MSKRAGIVAVLLLTLLAGVFAFVFWRAAGAREPAFEGRSLTSWLDHHVASSAANPPYGSTGWQEADEAIRHIGTNGLPTLSEMIRARDRPPMVIRLADTLQRLGLPVRRYRYATDRQQEAEYAFEMLGTNAAAAVPELIRIYGQNISASSQMCAAMALGHIGSEARAALPALLRNFNHTNDDTRFYAVTAVMSIGGEPGVVIPALTAALKDAKVGVRWNALNGLGRFGGRARSAVPEILKMLDDPGMVGTDSIIPQVTVTLWHIAPEQVGRPLVIEDPTPMITNGVTAQALKAVFDGKRRAIIRPGRAVPILGQYWNSDPRPRLTLYRGDLEANDHFLGDFEVLDVPASDSPNITTLFVLADGKLFLCARDPGRNQFLEARRVDAAAMK